MMLGRTLLRVALVGALLMPLGWASAAFDSSEESVVLVGDGLATVRRFGRSAECEGPNPMVVEASKKPFGLEPTLTIQYSGGRALGDVTLNFACAYGHRIQPPQRTISGDYSGAFSANHSFDGQTWFFQASAPQPDGTRDVFMAVSWTNGDLSTFQGKLLELR